MVRIVLILAIALSTIAIECETAFAKGGCGHGYRGAVSGRHYRHRGSHRIHRPYYSQPSSFGFSLGVQSYPGFGYSTFGYYDPYRFDGFGYDPYRRGTFRAPDLLDDPYIRARTRYPDLYRGHYRSR